MSSTPPEPALQEMLDEYALRKLVHTYCRAVDRGDLEALPDLYHRDAEDRHGAFSSGSVDGFIERLAASRRHLRSTQHHVTTTNFAIRGDSAEGEIYSIATHTFAAKGGETEVIVGGRYLDKYEKRNGTWRFLERAIVTDWAHVHEPSSVDLNHPMVKDSPKGTLGEDDPSHLFFTMLGKRNP